MKTFILTIISLISVNSSFTIPSACFCLLASFFSVVLLVLAHTMFPLFKQLCVTENYRFFNAALSSIILALYRRPKFFETLFSITVICSFQVRCSSVDTPKYLIEVIRFISISLINNDGSLLECILDFIFI